MSGVLARVREAAACVAERARRVRLDEEGLAALAARLHAAPPPPAAWDTRTHHAGTPASRLAYVVTLDAINFGSGWFPKLRKRAGRSGYFTIAIGLAEHFDAKGPWSAEQLTQLTPADLAAVTGQTLDDPEVAELMGLYRDALRDLGQLLLERYDGCFDVLVASAEGSAEALVARLAEMPLFRDVAHYGGREVPFYKRAQITAWDLALAFDGAGPGRFGDLDALTCFADNLVPHVLHCEGVLRYDEALAARIEAGELIAAGSPEEVEIRALGVHAVERLVGALRDAGLRASAREIDLYLWQRGQRPEIKAHPRHRTRCTFY